MNFDFNQDQQNIRQVARDFFSRECAMPVVRDLTEQPAGYSEAMWRQMAEIGLQGLPFPEEYGGQGLGFVELAIVLEEMGRTACPSPYFATVVLAGSAIAAGADENGKARYLPGIANGETRATLATLEDDINWTPSGIQLRAERDGDAWRLTGVKRFVPFAHCADLIVVAARTGDSPEAISLFVVEPSASGLTIEPVQSIDRASRDCTLRLDGARVEADRVIGPVDGGWPAVAEAQRRGAVAACALMLGAARKSLEMSVEYAKVRQQFDQPIGSFQAIKHMAAEMLMDVENSHSATYYAAWAQDEGGAEAQTAAAVAKSFVSEAARTVVGKALQLHGGIGFTWDHDLHYFMKRVYHDGPLYVDPEGAREMVVEQVLGAAEPVAVG